MSDLVFGITELEVPAASTEEREGAPGSISEPESGAMLSPRAELAVMTKRGQRECGRTGWRRRTLISKVGSTSTYPSEG